MNGLAASAEDGDKKPRASASRGGVDPDQKLAMKMQLEEVLQMNRQDHQGSDVEETMHVAAAAAAVVSDDEEVRDVCYDGDDDDSDDSGFKLAFELQRQEYAAIQASNEETFDGDDQVISFAAAVSQTLQDDDEEEDYSYEDVHCTNRATAANLGTASTHATAAAAAAVTDDALSDDGGGKMPAKSSSGDVFDSEISAIDVLTDVTFGRKPALNLEPRPIDFRTIDNDDLKSLAAMVIMEYKELLDRGIYESDGKSKDTPHAFDVFLLQGSSYSRDMELAICKRLPGSNNGDLGWYNKDGNYMRLDEIEFGCRVASLIGSARILESIMSKPSPGSLKEQAMKRVSLVDVVEKAEIPRGPSTAFLNESQRRVVETVCSPSFQSGLLAIQGPPGTGKTTTIVRIVSEVGSAIVTAPSNAAVANLALQLVSTHRFGTRDVVVFGENCESSVQFLNPTHRRRRYQGFLRSWAKSDDARKKEKLRDFASWLGLNSSNASFDDIDSLCGSDGEDWHIASASVILCTVNTAGSASLRKATRPRRFELLILDEASQCTEAEFYILTTFPGVGRIVVVGDPRQLPATVLDQGCRDMGYGESFLSNLLKSHPYKVHMLNVQYRMDPAILRFSNEHFYASKIRSADCVCGRQPRVVSPFQFVDTSLAGDVERKDGPSYYNEYEVIVVKSIICGDRDIKELLKSSTSPRVIVITPYQAQVRRLQEELRKIKRRRIDVATVDSFQGQEGDVVIVSLVRTRNAGFVDGANRLNVSLTRSKRVLRVVGSLDLLKSTRVGESALQKLACYVQTVGAIEEAQVSASWMRPDWNRVTQWKPTMTSRFHHSLKDFSRMEKNIAFNTILAVAAPDHFVGRPGSEGKPKWNLSSLAGYADKIHVVWLAKEYEWKGGPQADSHYVGTVEAHFAGTRKTCLTFMQKHPHVPMRARNVKKDMSALVACENTVATDSADIDFSWLITNDLQDAVFQDDLEDLPEGLFTLDPDQERIITLQPPLLVDSGAGTGKTNVLFQHAISYSRGMGTGLWSPICFVTVSPKLLQDLERRYKDIVEKVDQRLPEISFLSFRHLLDSLLRVCRISDMSTDAVCTFLEYVHSRTSHQKLAVEASLVESEIGGVISGSLTAALESAPLRKEQYLDEIRSNVPKDSTEGQAIRNKIYNVFESYQQWKSDHKKYDISDIVLKLIGSVPKQQIFQSVYLDEVQDFSYASIFLVCSIAGKKEMQWTAAGDTAQMISPGCSFTFSGMKNTLLAINEDAILRKVEKLKRNYRTTKAVLEVGNAILQLIKENFPGSIEYAQPEIPMKDLGLPVVLCDWEAAFDKNVSFGVHQAVICSDFSGSNSLSDSLSDSICNWLGNHPFILTSLESKGLEFDDVVVVFSMDRKTWDIGSKRNESLRMLRELYVAITRARRRVVILQKRGLSAMKDFFLKRLNCDIEESDAEIISTEFNKMTAVNEWFSKGTELFQAEQYNFASNCFVAAGNLGWSGWARGRHLLRNEGKRSDAKAAFRTAVKFFYDAVEYEHCLELMSEIGGIPPWEDVDNVILDEALKMRPNYLPRHETVKFALSREAWSTISCDDFKDRSCSKYLLEYRDDTRLKEMVQNFQEADLLVVERILPAVVGDFYLSQGQLPEAVTLFLRGQDQVSALDATEMAMHIARDGHGDLARVVECWRGRIPDEIAQIKNSKVTLLLSLFDSPLETAATRANECMEDLGPQVIKLAVATKGLGIEALHKFDKEAFQEEVLDALSTKYAQSPVAIVRWYHEQRDDERAVAFVEQRLKDWTNEELVAVIFEELALHPLRYAEELVRRELHLKATQVSLSSQYWNLDLAVEASDRALRSIDLVNKNAVELRKIWFSRRNDNSVKLFMIKNRSSSNIALLMYLFEHPKEAGRRYGKKCMAKFGEETVKMAVRKKMAVGKDYWDALKLFDGKRFAPPKTQPPTKPSAGDNKTNQSKRNKFGVGDRVRVTGLKTDKGSKLNGRLGTVKSPLTKAGRYAIKVDGEKENLSILPENLDAVTDRRHVESNNDSPPDHLPQQSGQRRANGKRATGTGNKHRNTSNVPPAFRFVDGSDSTSYSVDGQDSPSDESSMPPLQGRDSEPSGTDNDTVPTPSSVAWAHNNGDDSSSYESSSDSEFPVPQAQTATYQSDPSSDEIPPALLAPVRNSSSSNSETSGQSHLATNDSDSDSEGDAPPDLMPRQLSDPESEESMPDLVGRNDTRSTGPGNARKKRNRKRKSGNKKGRGGRR